MCEYVHGKMDYDDFFVASLDGRVLNFKSSLFIEKLRERGLQKQESKRGIFRCKILSQGNTCHKCEEGPLKATFATIAKTVLN